MAETKPLDIMDGKTLLSLEIEPPKFIISRFLPTGLHMLAGSPKIGKSWLALWLCHQVSKGEPVWEIKKGTHLRLLVGSFFARAVIVRLRFKIAPNQPFRSQTLTAGNELRLALKRIFHNGYSVYSLGGLPEKSAMTAFAFTR